MRLRLIQKNLKKKPANKHYIVSFQDGELRLFAEKLKIPVYVLAFKNGFLAFLPRLITLPFLIKKVREINPDIIHSLPWIPNLISRCFLIFFISFDCKILNDLHGTAYISSFQHWVDKKTYFLANFWVFVSKPLYDFFFKLKWKVPKSFLARGVVLQNFVDTSDFCFDKKRRLLLQKKFNFTEKDLVLSFVGRLDKVKRISFLLDCFDFIKREEVSLFARLKLLVCGAGPEEESLKKQVLKMGLENVFFLGNLHFNEVVDVYNLSDALILCSESEGMPTVVLEALANGLLVFLSANLQQPWHKKISQIHFFKDEKSLVKKIDALVLQKKIMLKRKVIKVFSRKQNFFY